MTLVSRARIRSERTLHEKHTTDGCLSVCLCPVGSHSFLVCKRFFKKACIQSFGRPAVRSKGTINLGMAFENTAPHVPDEPSIHPPIHPSITHPPTQPHRTSSSSSTRVHSMPQVQAHPPGGEGLLINATTPSTNGKEQGKKRSMRTVSPSTESSSPSQQGSRLCQGRVTTHTHRA